MSSDYVSSDSQDYPLQELEVVPKDVVDIVGSVGEDKEAQERYSLSGGWAQAVRRLP